jgi:hypothetical protein
MQINDWIVQSRAGTAQNTALKQKPQKTLFENESEVAEKQSQLEKQNAALSHKQLIESIVTSVDDVISIFLCISQRLQMEELIKSKADQKQLI